MDVRSKQQGVGLHVDLHAIFHFLVLLQEVFERACSALGGSEAVVDLDLVLAKLWGHPCKAILLNQLHGCVCGWVHCVVPQHAVMIACCSEPPVLISVSSDDLRAMSVCRETRASFFSLRLSSNSQVLLLMARDIPKSSSTTFDHPTSRHCQWLPPTFARPLVRSYNCTRHTIRSLRHGRGSR